jgi:hypothetical protein
MSVCPFPEFATLHCYAGHRVLTRVLKVSLKLESSPIPSTISVSAVVLWACTLKATPKYVCLPIAVLRSLIALPVVQRPLTGLRDPLLQNFRASLTSVDLLCLSVPMCCT